MIDRRNFFSNFARSVVIGAVSSVATASIKQLDEVVEKEIVLERHQFQESLDLLNCMREAGGVRLIESGYGDNGAPVGYLPENIMRHTNFGRINRSILSEGIQFDNSAIPFAHPRAPCAPGTRLHPPEASPRRHVPLLQEDLEEIVCGKLE